MAVLPGGERFVSASENQSGAKLWTLEGGLERTFDDMSSNVFCTTALPDGVHFVVGLGYGRNRNEVRLYHVDGTRVHTFEGHTSTVRAVAVTPDGQHIISGGGFDTLVKVWSVDTKSLVSTCAAHTDDVEAVAAMPDGQRILSMGTHLRVWRLDGTLENTFELHTGYVHLVRCPTTSTRSPARTTRPSSSSTSTTAPSCAPSSTTTTRCSAWRCCPTASASSAARATRLPASPHGLAP